MAHFHRRQWEQRLLRYFADRLMREVPDRYEDLGEAFEWWSQRSHSLMPPPGNLKKPLEILDEIFSWIEDHIDEFYPKEMVLLEKGEGYRAGPDGDEVEWKRMIEGYLAHDRPRLFPAWQSSSQIPNPDAFSELVGTSAIWKETIRLIQIAAGCDITALIIGEYGTGKNLVAQVLHKAGRRFVQPFLHVNCKELTPENLESKVSVPLDAASDPREPYIHEGTLYFDDLGGLSKEAQVALLKLLDRFEAASRNSRRVPRLLFSSNVALDLRVKRGDFRRDLYFRISIFQIDLPPLRQRREDIEPLVYYLIPQIAARLGIRAPKITSHAIALLIQHNWEMNVRGLSNTLERSITSRREVIEAQDLIFAPRNIEIGPPDQEEIRRALDTLDEYGIHLDRVHMKSLVAFLKNQGDNNFRTSSIVKELGIASSTARSYTNKLTVKGFLKKYGDKKGTTYKVVPGKLFPRKS